MIWTIFLIIELAPSMEDDDETLDLIDLSLWTWMLTRTWWT